MSSFGPGASLCVAAIVLWLFGELASRAVARDGGKVVGAGAAHAVRFGAALCLVCGGLLEMRSAQLEQVEAGTLLATSYPHGPGWLGAVPLLAVGVGITAIATRELALGHLRGAAGWVGAVMVAGFFLVVEMSGGVWFDVADALQVREGVVLTRRASVLPSEVEAVTITEHLSPGAPKWRVSLAGPRLPEAFTRHSTDFDTAHGARLEAERWAAVGRWSVTETQAK